MPLKIKTTYIVSNINKAIAFEWIATNLPKEKFELSFLLLNPGPSELETFFLQNKVPVTRINLQGKSTYLSALFGVIRYLFKVKPAIIHCHLFDASLIGLAAGKLLGIKKRITTRHHSTYNWLYNRKGVWFDKIINSLATDIIAISENVKNVLIQNEKVNEGKISLIHHGFDLKAFQQIGKDRIQLIHQKYNPNKKSPVIGVISRWIEWKGIQYIIPAFRKLLVDYPDALLVLANANGPYKNEIKELLSKLPKNSYQVIPFENDLFALYQLFDVYVHAPINPQIEAFGQTYVEALAAGIPSVFTLSGVAQEFVKHKKNALVVPFKNSDEIYNNIKKLLEDKSLQKNLIEKGRDSVQLFLLKNMINKLAHLYLGTMSK